MRNRDTLGPWLRRFLVEHIVTERNLARNTRKSYRDTFALLVPFLSRKARKSDERLAVRDLTSSRVRQFLAHLEDQRGCSAQTRNLRLTAIRAFARFVASRDPAQVAWSGHIRAIPAKKGDAAAHRLAEPQGCGCDGGGAGSQDPARTNGARPSHVPLQHRSTGLGSRAVDSGRPADRPRQRPLRPGDAPRQGRKDTPVPAAPGDRAHARRPGPRLVPGRSRVPQQAPQGLHPVRDLPARRAFVPRRSPAWPAPRSRPTRSGTASPVTCCTPRSTSTPCAPGSATPASTPPTSTPRST